MDIFQKKEVSETLSIEYLEYYFIRKTTRENNMALVW